MTKIFEKYKCIECHKRYNKLKNSNREIDIKRRKAFKIKKIDTEFGYCKIHDGYTIELKRIEYLTGIKIIYKSNIVEA